MLLSIIAQICGCFSNTQTCSFSANQHFLFQQTNITNIHSLVVRFALPYAIHGDAVASIRTGRSGSKSLDVYSWHGLLGRGGTLLVKHLMVSIFKCSVVAGTMDAIWKILLWSLHWMFLGLWPDRDWDDKIYGKNTAEGQLALSNLAGGFFAVPWTIKGDLKFFHEDLNMKKWDAASPCDDCDCHREEHGDDGMRHLNFGVRAPWKRTLLTPTQWIARNPNRHALFLKFLFLSHMNRAWDELHVMYLGVNQTLLGTVLWILVYKCLDGTPSDNLAIVWSLIKDAYTAEGYSTQFTALTLNSFTDPRSPSADYPRLKGRGMEVKCLLGPLLTTFKQLHRKESEDDRDTILIMRMMLDIQDTFDEYIDFNFLPPEQSARVLKLGDQYLETWAILSNRAAERSELLYQTLPKHHCFWHLCEKTKYDHPRLGNTCLDEDYVGRIKRVAGASANGCVTHKIPQKVMDKSIWGKSLIYTYPYDF